MDDWYGQKALEAWGVTSQLVQLQKMLKQQQAAATKILKIWLPCVVPVEPHIHHTVEVCNHWALYSCQP